MTKAASIFVLCLTAMFAFLLAVPLSAHSSPNSEITLDLAPGGMRADIIVPQSDYAFVTDNPVTNQARSLAAAQHYLDAHLAVIAPDGRAWSKRFESIEFAQISGPPDLHAIVELSPPNGSSDRSFTVAWDGVIEREPSHFTLLVIGNDLAGAARIERDVVGMFTAARPTLAIKRGRASSLNVFANSFLLGAHHIAVGYDHLLFLLALLLPAPLLAAGGRWRGERPVRDTFKLLGWIVTAFTIGHSTTLVLSTVFDAKLPAAPVEILIALSVFISAIHAMRPIFPAREPVVALLFGLVHGLAFATLIGGYAVGSASRGITLLGFNLGIEAIQIGLVIATLPALVLLSRRAIYPAVRLTLAAIAAIASLAWLAERIFVTPNPVAGMAETLLPFVGAALALLSVVALVGALAQGVRRRRSANS